ncbi:MAG: hypothetical protein AABY51_08950 [Deltaproteobacteria bacterium]
MLKRDAAFIGAIAAPAVFFFWVVALVALNIPIGDDFDTILGFLNRFLSAGGLIDKAGLLFEQHNEHRLVFSRLVALIQYYLFGEADLRGLIIFGNLSLAGLFVTLALIYRQRLGRVLYLLPASLIIFNFEYYETVNWAMASVSNLYVLFFALLSLYLLLARSSAASFAGAILCYAAAAFTQGGGLFVGLAGIVMLAIGRQFNKAALWSLVTVALFSIYFYGYHTPAGHPSVLSVISADPSLPIRFFFSFLGSPLPMPEVFGIFSFGFFIYLTLKGYCAENRGVYTFLLFLFITAAVTALTRSGFGLDQSLASRYKVVASLIFAIHYLVAVEIMKAGSAKRIFVALAIAGSLVFNINAYLSNRAELAMQKEVLTYGYLQWQENGRGLIYPFEDKAGAILARSEELRTYAATPDKGIVSANRVEMKPGAEDGSIRFEIDSAFTGASAVFIDGWAFAPDVIRPDSARGQTYIVLRSGSREYVFDAIPRKRPDIGDHFMDRDLDWAGFISYIPVSGLGSGVYSLGLYITDGGKGSFVLTDAEITL